ncbi:MAG: nucleoside-diphosphate kinase [Candidatus Taylorbacteria bacterium CG11_big_fil_rev_8_21_14_0_20_46_11]|uniref:nucleoside-diphosphate kinase n=1 Tax=Candidatus Taylorbacteria bacterium CG11_big_fil_rev_8_21_14_0_20_46_11 TaxID=1975025 RepID=A0A2H0KBW8_9BACT|nr:MAG: nucleoside-diphosphate kinase [Candidatus Taylorbacteria bacterium CG11_big_fil_rev_8_21_14_0_20_46_11]
MNHPKAERTLVVIKPDGVQRTLMGEIIGRYERLGLKLVGIKLIVPTKAHIETHYNLDPNWKRIVGEKSIEAYQKKGLTPPSMDPLVLGDKVIESLQKYMTSGPVVAMVWQGAHVVKIVRKMTGGTEPLTSDVGTIRGDYVHDSYQMADTDARAVRNLIHASGSVEEAENEIAHWFKKEELINYRLIQEQILYDVNIDGLLE